MSPVKAEGDKYGHKMHIIVSCTEILSSLLVSKCTQSWNIYKSCSANVSDCQDIYFLNELEISLAKMSSQKIYFFNYQRLKVKKQIKIYIIILSVCIWNEEKNKTAI